MYTPLCTYMYVCVYIYCLFINLLIGTLHCLAMLNCAAIYIMILPICNMLILDLLNMY